MDFYNNPDKVDEYEKMCEEYDGTELYNLLSKHLQNDSTILELGCGPGFDIHYFKDNYRVTGSDLSDEFLSRCIKRFPGLDFLKLNAISLETNKMFDCVFSNKVLHHLTTEELEKSLRRQKEIINESGLFAHTFWIGDKEFEMEGLLFLFHNKQKLIHLISKYFNVIEAYEYKELEEGDSLFVIAENISTNL